MSATPAAQGAQMGERVANDKIKPNKTPAIEAATAAALSAAARYVVALSGGADSTALTLAVAAFFENAPERICVAHFDHGLRADSAADASHVKRVCERLKLKLVCDTGDAARLAERDGLSLEDAARRLRYRFLARVVAAERADVALTGHTEDDQVETALMNIMRGGGITAVAGMRADSELAIGARRLRIIRPLLRTRRAECEAYCRARGFAFLTDPSNADLKFTRNKTRLALIPQMEQTVGGARDALARLTRHAAQIRDYMRAKLDKLTPRPFVCRRGVVHASRADFNALPAALQPLRLQDMWRLVGQAGELLTQNRIDAAIACAKPGADSGKTLELGGGVRLLIEHDELLILPPGVAKPPCHALYAPVRPARLTVGGAVTVGAGRVLTVAPASARQATADGRFAALVSRDLLKRGLYVRRRRAGDTFAPAPRRNPIKLNDFLIKERAPSYLRDDIPLITAGERIIWVVGYRVAADIAPAPDALRLTLSGGDFKECSPAPNRPPRRE